MANINTPQDTSGYGSGSGGSPGSIPGVVGGSGVKAVGSELPSMADLGAGPGTLVGDASKYLGDTYNSLAGGVSDAANAATGGYGDAILPGVGAALSAYNSFNQGNYGQGAGTLIGTGLALGAGYGGPVGAVAGFLGGLLGQSIQGRKHQPNYVADYGGHVDPSGSFGNTDTHGASDHTGGNLVGTDSFSQQYLQPYLQALAKDNGGQLNYPGIISTKYENGSFKLSTMNDHTGIQREIVFDPNNPRATVQALDALGKDISWQNQVLQNQGPEALKAAMTAGNKSNAYGSQTPMGNVIAGFIDSDSVHPEANPDMANGLDARNGVSPEARAQYEQYRQQGLVTPENQALGVGEFNQKMANQQAASGGSNGYAQSAAHGGLISKGGIKRPATLMNRKDLSSANTQQMNEGPMPKGAYGFADGGMPMQQGVMQPPMPQEQPQPEPQIPNANQPNQDTADDVPAKLTDGEFVFDVDTVRFYGVDKLKKMQMKAQEAMGLMRKEQQPKSEPAPVPNHVAPILPPPQGMQPHGTNAMAKGGLVDPMQQMNKMPKYPGVVQQLNQLTYDSPNA